MRRKPRRHDGDDGPHRAKGRKQQNDLRDHLPGIHPVGEPPRRIMALALAHRRIARKEGEIERALGEDRAEIVGQAERDKKRIR